MRQDTDNGCRWMLPKWFSSLTTPQKTPTHRLSEPTVSRPWALNRHSTCSNAQNIIFRCTNNNNKNHIQKSSLNIPKIDFPSFGVACRTLADEVWESAVNLFIRRCAFSTCEFCALSQTLMKFPIAAFTRRESPSWGVDPVHPLKSDLYVNVALGLPSPKMTPMHN